MAAVNAAAKSTPKEAQIMAAILKDMGVNEYEPRVINQMMEFSYREHMFCFYGNARTQAVVPLWPGVKCVGAEMRMCRCCNR